MLHFIFFTRSYLPALMIETIIVPIVKNKCGTMCESNNYIPIALATLMSKLFESVILLKWDTFLGTCPNQFGMGKSYNGVVYDLMKCSRHTYHYSVRRVKKNKINIQKQSVIACSWTGLFEVGSSNEGGVVFTGLLIEGYVQQSKDDNTRNNNEKPSTKIKENIQSY